MNFITVSSHVSRDGGLTMKVQNRCVVPHKRIRSRAGALAVLAKYLACKHEDLNLNPNNCIKIGSCDTYL